MFMHVRMDPWVCELHLNQCCLLCFSPRCPKYFTPLLFLFSYSLFPFIITNMSLPFFPPHPFIPIIIRRCPPPSVTIEMTQCPFRHKAKRCILIFFLSTLSLSICPASFLFISHPDTSHTMPCLPPSHPPTLILIFIRSFFCQ